MLKRKTMRERLTEDEWIIEIDVSFGPSIVCPLSIRGHIDFRWISHLSSHRIGQWIVCFWFLISSHSEGCGWLRVRNWNGKQCSKSRFFFVSSDSSIYIGGANDQDNESRRSIPTGLIANYLKTVKWNAIIFGNCELIFTRLNPRTRTHM